MLTLNHLEIIQKVFFVDEDAQKILTHESFKGWNLPVSQISYISDVIDALGGDISAAMNKFKSDEYVKELSPFMPGFKKIPKKPRVINKQTKKSESNPSAAKTKHPEKLSENQKSETRIVSMDSTTNIDRIIKYQTVSAHSIHELNKEVNKEMELYSWIPYGGVSVAHAGIGSSFGGPGSYFQAMVKLRKK
jgi:hypothetical protein